jgi:hypothetical protein
MKKVILALSVLFAGGLCLQAHERIVQETFEVSCNACGHQHYITETRNEVVAPAPRVHAKKRHSDGPALMVAGGVIGAAVATVVLTCAVVVPSPFFLLGCVWFMAAILSTE